LAILLVFYLVLLVHPVPLPFARDMVRNAVVAAMPEGSQLELGDMSLALENASWPVLRFTPVTYSDSKSGGVVTMEALEVGFSPLRAIIGQPGASITMVAPHIQMVQDLLGPRLSRFTVVDDPNGGAATVRVQEGSDTFPSVHISSEGLAVHGALPTSMEGGLRSDNDWMIFNMEGMEQSLRNVVQQTEQGRFSRFIIRDGTMDMTDAVYGLLRQFKDINLDVAPKAIGHETDGKFSASLGGRKMVGSVSRSVAEDGTSLLHMDVTNIDFASFVPFIDDPDSLMAIRGSGALSMDMHFDSVGKVMGGQFDVDMTGSDLRIESEYYPIVTSIMKIDWTPQNGEFTLEDSSLRIGDSSATIGGVFLLGLDDLFGPTAGISLTAKNVSLHPSDMAAPTQPFDEISFKGWSAPLYGAVGIDQLAAKKGDARIATTGRVDALRRGLGFDLTVAGENVALDDVKRLWPYFLATDSRDWFVKNVTAGTISTSTMKFSFPVGTLARKGEEKPIPQNGITIDMAGTGVVMRATDTMAPVAIDGNTRLTVRDSNVTLSADGAQIPTTGGPIDVANAALIIDSSVPKARTLEVSGDVKGDISSMLALANEQQPGAVANAKLPIDVAALAGKVGINVVATVQLGAENAIKQFDYVVSGSVADFSSKAPIQSRSIKDGQLAFTATQAGYKIGGTAQIDGMPSDISIEGKPDSVPVMQLGSTLEVADLKKMGFDASQFLSGQVRFLASPQDDGSIQMAVDLQNASLTIKDLGISKPVGVAGLLKATIKQDGSITDLSDIDLRFADVSLQGSLEFDGEKKELQSAEFSSFALSPGDKAQISLTPVRGGYSVRIRGEQLDLKPMLQRYFGLGEGSTGGVKATSFDQTLALDVQLDRAVGFYKTTAYNLNLNMALHGSDLLKVQMQAQMAGGGAVSIATNPAPNGHTMSVAFNDFGSVLRLLGVYPRVEGGEGSLVLASDTKLHVDNGEFLLRNFALIDEDKVAQILNNDKGSRQLIAKANKLEFKSGKLDFIRRSDRIEVTDGVLAGMSVGGTMKGFIYTDKRQYDLVGTYVPLFGLNNAFSKIPLFGPLLTGPDGAGMFGVTFAVRGALDNPDFQVNPASILAVGAFRSLFEFRAKELPRED
jgi:hypothetical protein